MRRTIVNSAKKAWQGQERLWIAFWGWFVIPNIMDGIINNLFRFDRFSFLTSLFPQTISGLNIALAIHVALLIPFVVFWAIVIWRCAKNANKKIWFYTARVFVSLFTFVTAYRISELVFHVIKWNIHS
jgi:hypothetical protein